MAIRLAILGLAGVIITSTPFENLKASGRPPSRFDHAITLKTPTSSYYPCQGIVRALVSGYRILTSAQRQRRRDELLSALSNFEPSKTTNESAQSDRTKLWRELVQLNSIDSKPLKIFFPHPHTWKPVEIVLTPSELALLAQSDRARNSFPLHLTERDVAVTSPHFARDLLVHYDSLYPSTVSEEQKNQILEKSELDARIKALLNDLGAETKDRTVYGRFETHYLNVMDSRIHRFKDLNASYGPNDTIHNPGDLRRIRDLSQKLGTPDWDQVVESILSFARSNFKDQAGIEKEAIRILDEISELDVRLKPEHIFSKDAVVEALQQPDFEIEPDFGAPHFAHPDSDPAKTATFHISPSRYTSAQEAHDAIGDLLIPPQRGLLKKMSAIFKMEAFDTDAFIYLKRNSPELYQKAKHQFIENAKSIVATLMRYTKDDHPANQASYRLLIKMENLSEEIGDTEWLLNPRDFRSPLK